MEKAVKMLISVSPDVRAWIENEAQLDERTLSSVVQRAVRAEMRKREEREQDKAAVR